MAENRCLAKTNAFNVEQLWRMSEINKKSQNISRDPNNQYKIQDSQIQNSWEYEMSITQGIFFQLRDGNKFSNTYRARCIRIKLFESFLQTLNFVRWKYIRCSLSWWRVLTHDSALNLERSDYYSSNNFYKFFFWKLLAVELICTLWSNNWDR